MAKDYIEERDGGYYVEEFETLTLTQVFGAITFYPENQPAIDAWRNREELRLRVIRSPPYLSPAICAGGLMPRARNSIPGFEIVEYSVPDDRQPAACDRLNRRWEPNKILGLLETACLSSCGKSRFFF